MSFLKDNSVLDKLCVHGRLKGGRTRAKLFKEIRRIPKYISQEIPGFLCVNWRNIPGNSQEFLGKEMKNCSQIFQEFPEIPKNSQEYFPRNPGNSFVLIDTEFPGILRNSWDKK